MKFDLSLIMRIAAVGLSSPELFLHVLHQETKVCSVHLMELWMLDRCLPSFAQMVRLMDGANAIFYALSMPSASGMGVAICVGTGYVIRRVAIEQLGGWVTGYAVEDSTTSLKLHEAGWRSKYLDVSLVHGLSPDTLAEFFQQRYDVNLECLVISIELVLLYRSLAMASTSRSPHQGMFTVLSS